MPNVVLVALGGALGAVSRYLLSGLFLHRYPSALFPYGTFACNVIGCLAIGLLAACATKYHWFSPDSRLLLITGLLGGFTTFSAFGYETFYLAKRGEFSVAAIYVVFSVACGLFAVWIGHRLVAA